MKNVKPTKVVAEVNPGCAKCQEQEKPPACTACARKAARKVPAIWNYSQAKRAASHFLGLGARVWQKNQGKNEISVGFELSPGRKVLGTGSSFQEAVENAVIRYGA